jgi:hypothetical protein
MPFLSKDLSVLAYANNFTLWHYTTPDIQTVVTTAGYFNNTASMVRVNDLIITSMNTGATAAFVIYIVTANNGTTVTIAPFVA